MFFSFPAYEQKAAADFMKFYDDLHLVSLPDHEVSALADRIDWAARFQYLIGRGATFDTITTYDRAQVRDDLKWDAIGERDIARRHFSKFGHTVMKPLIPGPPNTRAKTRTEIIKELHEADDLWSSRWSKVIAHSYLHYNLGGPLDTGYVLENLRPSRLSK